MDFGMVCGDGVGDLLQEDGLAGAGGRDDEGSLAFADGSKQIDEPGAERFRSCFHVYSFVGVNGYDVLELDEIKVIIGWTVVEGDEFCDFGILTFGAIDLGLYGEALLEGVLVYDVSGDEGVFLPLVDQERIPEETVISVGDFEDSFDDISIIFGCICQVNPFCGPGLTQHNDVQPTQKVMEHQILYTPRPRRNA